MIFPCPDEFFSFSFFGIGQYELKYDFNLVISTNRQNKKKYINIKRDIGLKILKFV